MDLDIITPDFTSPLKDFNRFIRPFQQNQITTDVTQNPKILRPLLPRLMEHRDCCLMFPGTGQEKCQGAIILDRKNPDTLLGINDLALQFDCLGQSPVPEKPADSLTIIFQGICVGTFHLLAKV